MVETINCASKLKTTEKSHHNYNLRMKAPWWGGARTLSRPAMGLNLHGKP